MKRLIAIIFFAAIQSSAFCAAPFKLVYGSSDCLHQNGFATIEFDFSSATWEEDETLYQYFGNGYDYLIKASTATFIDAYNLESKGLKITDNASKAQYKLVFTFYNFRATVGSFYRKFVRIYGHIDVIDLSTNQRVCSFQINKKKQGCNDYVVKEAFVKSFNQLGELFAQIK